MTYQQKKARAFAKTLREWDRFKEQLAQLLAAGTINDVEYNQRLTQKARELDL